MRRILVDFLNEENNKSIKFDYLIIIPIILLAIILLNNIVKLKISELETYIEDNYKYTSVSNLDYDINKNLIHISEIIEITKLINDLNIRKIKISNNKLSLIGYSLDSNDIKSYIKLLDKNDKVSDESIESINKEGETYSFEIEANVGSDNEI